jgi:hypothetical protein
VQLDIPVATKKVTVPNTASAATEDKVCIQNIGKLIKDLYHSDNAKV